MHVKARLPSHSLNLCALQRVSNFARANQTATRHQRKSHLAISADTFRFWRVRPALPRIMLFLLGTVATLLAIEQRPDGIHVVPGDNIQQAIDLAAHSSTQKVVKVHAGEYRPNARRQALIWFNRAHDGVVVEAVGPVTLSAANPALSRPSAKSYPAVVNHVVYFGHGISSNTILRGFKITGANACITDKFLEQIEPDSSVPKNSFFLTDGGGIKLFGESGPTLERLEVAGNFASPCAGGVSVQQQGLTNRPVIFRDCIFKNNRAQVTGAAIDLLEGSAAQIINCLFVGNVANTGIDTVSRRSGETPFTNSGVVTIFQNSRAIVQNCTFAKNRNGIDDLGGNSSYLNCIFCDNTLDGGLVPALRYDLSLLNGGTVRGCFFTGALVDPANSISPAENTLKASDPNFDVSFAPRNELFKNAGYRAPSAH